MSYPCRYGDMIHRFAKPVPVLSMINNHMIDYIYDTHGHKVLNWNHEILSPVNLQMHVNAITAMGAPLDNCFGFIDGTVRPISHPKTKEFFTMAISGYIPQVSKHSTAKWYHRKSVWPGW